VTCSKIFLHTSTVNTRWMCSLIHIHFFMYSPSVVQRLFHSDWFRGTRHQLFSHANNPITNEVAKEYSNATVRPSVFPSVGPSHPCEHSRINILQWILTKLGTYLVLKRILKPIDFQGHMSKFKVTGSNFYRITSL
jgi:hypothetical protein